MNLQGIFKFIPEVRKPEEKKLSFNIKLKWTLIVLGAFFILANIPLFGLSENALIQFEYLAIILGTDFGSIISLGIGPIVTASIILQLLTGAGIINIDQNTEEGKKLFQGIQKLLVFFFIVFEAIVFVMLQGLQAAPGFAWLVILQLILGGLAIYYMDEVTSKWGFGSGVSLFIAAGVSWRLFTSAFQFIDTNGRLCFGGVPCPGRFLALIQAILDKIPVEFVSALAAILATILIFLLIIWAQSLKVEIPLSFGRIRGYGVKWPLAFFYSSTIPVIFTAALVANVQLFGGLIQNAAEACIATGSCSGFGSIAAKLTTFIGTFVQGQPVSGIAFWMGSTNILDAIIRGSGGIPRFILQGITHILTFVILSTVFSIFWVKTANMDARAQAKKITSSGLQVSGFRQDERVIESILKRYIMPLTVMGGIAIGFLAAITDLLGALVSGTSILLVVMIIFQFGQNIAQQHQTDMNPAMRKFIGG
jgi:preprotein translocase subunit SecY